MSFLEGFELVSGTGWKAAAQAAPAALAGFQAIKAKRDYGNKVKDIETLMENRQQLNNPYANMSNPFANLSVATEAARFQAEQSDIALANTLDNLRQTGAGGATALAQAALQSKRGVSANIQQQEAQNQKLQAQGQQRVDLAKAQGQMQVMGLQEQRDVRDLNMLQDQADLLKAQEIYSTQSAMSSLGKGLETLAGGLVPTQLPGVSGSTMDNTNFTRNATEAANQAGLNQIANIQLMNPGQDPSFDFSLSADIYADPQGKNDWQKSGLSNMVKDRERLKQAGESTVELQALIDSTRQKFGI
jgi:hypothetical protein